MADALLSPYPVVLQVLPALNGGGVERGTAEMASAIARAGGLPLVASAGGHLAPGIEMSGGRNLILPLDSKNPYTMWRNAARLADIIRREHVDIVHARSRAPAWSALLAAERTGAHFITTYHGSYNEDLPFKRKYNAVMARGELVIAISRHIAGLIRTQHHVPPERIRIIPRGVDPVAFDPERVSVDRIVRLARAWRLPDGQRTIMAAGAAGALERAGGVDRGARPDAPSRRGVHPGRGGSGQGSLQAGIARTRGAAWRGPRGCGWSGTARTCQPPSPCPTWW